MKATPTTQQKEIPWNLGDLKINEATAGKIFCLPSQTFVDPLNANPDDIHIEDIAWASSMICRYGGHAPRHFSVANHSLIVSSLVPSTHRLAALIHDAEEAYLGDWPTPLKVSLEKRYPGIKSIFTDLRKLIYAKFEVDYAQHAEIKWADTAVYTMERNALLRSFGTIPAMSQQEVVGRYLSVFNECVEQRKRQREAPPVTKGIKEI